MEYTNLSGVIENTNMYVASPVKKSDLEQMEQKNVVVNWWLALTWEKVKV